MHLPKSLFAAFVLLIIIALPNTGSAEQADGNVCIHAGTMVMKTTYSSDKAILNGLGRGVDRFGNPVLVGSNLGFRYNKYIVYEKITGLGSYKYDLPRHVKDPQLRKLHREHGRVLKEMIEKEVRAYAARFLTHMEPGTPEYIEAEKREIKQARERGIGRYFLKNVVFFAPLHSDAFHQCRTGRYTPIAGEFALFAGEPSPRVRGDLCTDSPVLLFDVYPSITADRARRLDEVKYFSKSELILGKPLSVKRYDFYRRNNMRLETRLLEVLDLIARQCPEAPKQIDLILQQQDVSLETMRSGDLKFNTLYRGTLRQTINGKFALETTELSALGEKLFGKVAKRQRQLAAQRRHADRWGERFALGVVFTVGILAGLEIYSPCHDPTGNSSTVLMACQNGR